MMGWVLLVGCVEDPGGKGQAVVDDGASLTFTAGRVIDPKLEAAALSVDATGCDTPTVQNGRGQLRTLESGSWDGRDDAGVAFDPGPAVVACGAASETVYVVRLGVAAVDFVSGATGEAVPLAYHKRSLVLGGVSLIDGPEYLSAPDDVLSALDDDAGAPRAAVEPWTEAMIAPWGAGDASAIAANVPAAYTAGASVRAAVTAGETAVGAGGAPVDAFGPDEGPTVRVVVDGATADWAPGSTVALELSPVAGTLGVETRTLTWRWEALDGEDWTPIPGSFTTTHTLYRTAGPAQLRDGTALGFAPAVPWVSVLAELAPELEGVEPDTGAVLDVIRDHIHNGGWITYDPNDGSYSNYVGSYIYWEYAWSELTGWIDREEGMHLYCHSVSCLYSVLAGHWGVYAPQQVLGVGFTTNYVRAAGTTAWLKWSFNSHSVVSPDDGATLWDASIAMDGDGDPGHEPITEMAPKGLSFEEYTTLLTADRVDIVNSGLCYFE